MIRSIFTVISLTALLGLACTPVQTACAAAPTSGSAGAVQLIDPAAFGFGRPGYMVDATFVDTQDLANRPGGIGFYEVRTILPLWTQKHRDVRVALSLGYNITEIDFGGLAGLQSESLHTLEAQMSLFWRPEQTRWWGLGFVTPGISSDFQDVSWDDAEIAGLGLLGYRLSDSFSFAGGLFARYGAGEGMIVPALGFIWQPDPFIVQVTPPFVVLGWRATDRLTLSLSAYPSGGSWDLEDANVNRVELNGWQAAASIIYQVTDHFSVSLRTGMNVAGELELRDGGNRVITNETLEAAPFAAVNLRWQF